MFLSNINQRNHAPGHADKVGRWACSGFLLIMILFLYGCFCAKDTAIVTLEEKVAGNEPCRIVFLADLHLSVKSFNEKNVMQLPGAVNALQPDWVLLGGDTFDIKAESEKELFPQLFAAWLQTITPRFGFVLVTGDHDDQLSEPGWLLVPDIRVLQNDAMRLSPQIILWGSNYPGWESETILEKIGNVISSAQPDDVILCLTHAPDFFDFLPDDSRILQLSGDTHGGLVHFPGIPDGYITELFGYQAKYVNGWYGHKGGKRLFVSSGFGGQGIRGIRIGIAPQIVLIVFHAADAGHTFPR